MTKKLLRFLNIEQGEEKPVLLLVLQSLCIGVYLATYDVGATTMFTEAFGDDMLFKAFIVSGCIGILLSLLYGELQKRIAFSRLAIFNLILITVVITAMRFGFEVTDNKYLTFFVYIMWGPLNAIVLLGFWGVAGRMFNLRQGKRLFGMIDTGQVFGMIVISFAVPLILMVMKDVKNLYVISIGSIVCALVLQLIINKSYGKQISTEAVIDFSGEEKIKKKKSGLLLIFRDKYLSKMALYMVVSIFGAFIIYSSFLDVTKEFYPNQNDRALFFSFFLATVMVFSFLIKTFLYAKLTSMYGLRVSLMILPIVVGMFVVAAVFFGNSYGAHVDSPFFIVYFLMVVLSRLFSHSLGMSLERPSLKVLYQPVNEEDRYSAMAIIDGVLNEFSGVLSGVILLALSFIPAYDTFYTTYLELFAIVSLAVVVLMLYKEYQKMLRMSLEKTTQNQTSINDYLNHNAPILESLRSHIPLKKLYAMKLAERVEPLLLEEFLAEMINDNSPAVRKQAIEQIGDLKIFNATDLLQARLEIEKDDELRQLLDKVLEELYLGQEISITYEYVENLVNSRTLENRKFAAQLIGRIYTEESLPLLLELIRDIEPEVRLAAIKTASRVQHPALWSFLTDNLSSPNYKRAATAALVTIGEPVLNSLESSFYRSGATTSELVQIVRIIGTIGSDKAIDLLLKKLTYPDTVVIREVLIALRKCKYRADEYNFSKIFQTLEHTVGVIAWNLSALNEVNLDHHYLISALEDENKQNYELLFLLLSLMYDAQSIKKVEENINLGSAESIGFALELLEIFLDEEVKVLLFALLDDKPLNDKVKFLQNYFPRAVYSQKEVLLQIINRDYNSIHKWTKSCATRLYGDQKSVVVSYDLIANLFNPEVLIRQETAKVIFRLDPKKYHECSTRIKSQLKWDLDNMLTSKEYHLMNNIWDRTLFLKEIKQFSGLSMELLVILSKSFDLNHYKEGKNVFETVNEKTNALCIVISGKVFLAKTDQEQELTKGDVFGLFTTNSASIEAITSSNTVLLCLETEKLFELMYNYKELVSVFVGLIDDSLLDDVIALRQDSFHINR